MHLIDAHCHLNEFDSGKTAPIIKNAKSQNVKTILSNSVDLNSMEKNIELQEKFHSIKACIGLHPSNLLHMNEKRIIEGMNFIEKNISKAIALGETGLDFRHAKTENEKEKQKKIFLQSISTAKEFQKPIIVHSRYAGMKCIELLQEAKAEKVLMHWFTNSEKEIRKAIDAGYFISAGPSILDSIEAQKNVKAIPLEKLLLETDAPVIFGGIPAEPAWIFRIAEKTAEIKEISLNELAEQCLKNALNLFGSKVK